jgi:RNA polymerase primary sigma factor
MARYEERDGHTISSISICRKSPECPVSPEREQELGRRIQDNDKTALEGAGQGEPAVRGVVREAYRNSHVLFLDLINEGNIGLIEAAKRFDPDKNVKFITYAVWWVRQAIIHALSDHSGAFRLPPKRANLMYRLRRRLRRR